MCTDENSRELISELQEKYNDDIFPVKMGVKLLELAPGRAVVELLITGDMLNLHGIAHGGMIFTMADTAFGLASNTRGPAVAMQANINFIRPAKPGSVLRATAQEEQLTRKTGVYNITVETDGGENIALLRGVVFRKEG
jgi:acyl-CoA thioesterase